MSHKAAIQLKGIKNASVGDRSAWVAAVWKLLAESGMKGVQELHDSCEIKGFVWNIEETEKNQFLMEFASAREELVDAVLRGAENATKSGAAWALSGDVLVKPEAFFPIDDFRVADGKIRFAAVSGIVVNKHARGKDGKKHHFVISPSEDPFAFVGNIKRNLVEKARLFSGMKIGEDEFALRVISSGVSKEMPFKGIPLIAHTCSLQLSGPKELASAALYAGLGRLNGLGFGMVVPMKSEKVVA